MIDTDYDLEKALETYRKDGSLIREKARMLVEKWLDQVYPRMVSSETPTSVLLDMGKALMELGDLKPKNQPVPQQQGAGFSITINVPSPNGGKPVVIEGTLAPDPQPAVAIDFDDLPPAPEWVQRVAPEPRNQALTWEGDPCE